MRQAFVHEAVVEMAYDGDIGAPGAAVTVALCGHWDHPSPCSAAPHHTDAVRTEQGVRLRILFAADPDNEHPVRRRVEAALATGQLRGPDGTLTHWRLCASRSDALTSSELDHGERLTRS
ncbi:hypothetical protein CC117_23895 [Parafrankia colletiae]|uniref:Uncharacterized protein n=1 Tax=Parafrankia colletiae TaxID=573497 RepID=A0A1S1QE62_9ACTN|nr:hypothetical protein [Parafrankia colletiae]MCK9902875.1 hypothetical protein [Frankia sp. Cpl3]OHV33078.1 hypothetical protein CC117_23895 [Parafrankia colletiae]